jgi:hypothetical protein
MLYKAGLVNNNLFLLNQKRAVIKDAQEELPLIIKVLEQLNL